LRTGKELRLPIKIGGNTAPAYVQCRAPTGAKDVVGALALAGSCPGDDWWDKTLSYTRFFSALPSYYDSRLLGSDFGLRLTGYAVHDYAIQAIDIDKYGLLTELQRRFGKLATSFGVDVGLIRSKRPEEPDFTTTGGMQPQLQVIPRLTYDGTDSPLNPTRGFFVTAALPLIDTIIKVPNPADCPTANTCRPQTYSFPQVRFVKWEVTGKAFFTLGSSLTWAALAHVGYGQSIEKTEPSATALPQPERYRLGGQFGLRGFADYGVRQYDSAGCTLATRPGVSGKVPIGQKCADGLDHPAQVGDVLAADGNVVANGSVEARFPLAREQGVWGSVFWDFGAVAEHWSGEAGGLHTGSFRSGLGVGLRWLLSGQIPVRVDYGVAIGRLHFGLLYSF
jgi:outer membrane protein assembly factor BamA